LATRRRGAVHAVDEQVAATNATGPAERPAGLTGDAVRGEVVYVFGGFINGTRLTASHFVESAVVH
jgi:hypothetical protein